MIGEVVKLFRTRSIPKVSVNEYCYCYTQP